MQADLVRAQLQRAELDREIITLRGERKRAVAQLLALLGSDQSVIVPSLTIDPSTAARSIDDVAVVADAHPAIAAVTAEIERAEQEMRLASLLAKPDWSVEAMYGMRPEQRDMVTLMARVELPLRRGSNIEPRIRAATLSRDAAVARREALRRQIGEDLAAAVAVHATATALLRLHDDVLLPQAKLAVEATLAAYEVGRVSFDAVLSTELSALRLHREYHDLLAQHIKAIVDFEALRRGARSGALAVMPSGAAAMAMPATVRATSTAAPMQGMR